MLRLAGSQAVGPALLKGEVTGNGAQAVSVDLLSIGEGPEGQAGGHTPPRESALGLRGKAP